jgi:hypothetical protein
MLISDSPPHGLWSSDDAFVNGCPCGKDSIKVAQKMKEKT